MEIFIVVMLARLSRVQLLVKLFNFRQFSLSGATEQPGCDTNLVLIELSVKNVWKQKSQLGFTVSTSHSLYRRNTDRNEW